MRSWNMSRALNAESRWISSNAATSHMSRYVLKEAAFRALRSSARAAHAPSLGVYDDRTLAFL